jgi:hypothetical protein
MKVFRIEFIAKGFGSMPVTVQLWVIARSLEDAIAKAKRHASKNFEDKRPILNEAKWLGTIDVK